MKPETSTILLKACPRCRGDLIYDPCEKQRLCLQCGHRLTRQQERELFGATRRERQLAGRKADAQTRRPDPSQVGVTLQL